MSDTGSTCAVYVYREGALSVVGHDLKLLVTGFTLNVRDAGNAANAANAGNAGNASDIGGETRDLGNRAVQASARTDTLRIAGVLGKGGAVDESEPGTSDRREIERSIVRDVLEADRYPVATFRSTAVEAAGGGWRITGLLELHGVVREVSFTAERRGERAVARFPLNQTDFRIKPFRAMMGALRVKREIILEVSAPLAPG